MTVDLDALEAQLAKAAPGPWTSYADDEEGGLDADVVQAADGSVVALARGSMYNAHTIAVLRNVAPELIAESRAARSRIATLREALEYWLERMPRCDYDGCGRAATTMGHYEPLGDRHDRYCDEHATPDREPRGDDAGWRSVAYRDEIRAAGRALEETR